MKTKPNFFFENKTPRGLIVMGIDEVGRGALAGPVVAGAVSLRIHQEESKNKEKIAWETFGINDSKKLSARKREKLALLIKSKARGWGIGEASVSTINKVGIVKATEKAMREAVRGAQQMIGKDPVFLLIDAFSLKRVKGVGLRNQQAVIKGDEQSLSIAAASIIAKVHRDTLMVKLHKRHPNYFWDECKGYGTKKHITALKKHGVSKLHRTFSLIQ